MMEAIIRTPRADETPELRHIWKTVFGTPDDKLFFSFFYNAKLSAAAVSGTALAAAGYLIPAGRIILGKSAVPCAMIYGVATLPEFRNRGYGAAVVRCLINAGREAGYPAIVLCPAGDSLFEYYSSRTELRDWFYMEQRRYEKPPVSAGDVKLTGINAVEYARLREQLLSGIPHIDMDPRAIEYQSLLCREFGGGLYLADSQDGVSCAAVETHPDGVVWVKELLGDGKNVSDIVSAIAERYPANEYYVRMPQNITTSIVSGSSRRFAMLSAPTSVFDAVRMENGAPWYGLAFD